MKKLISIVTPTFNEIENIEELVISIKNEMSSLKKYEYEHIVIDNNSQDGTQELLKKIAKTNKKLKIILNTKNFGHIRSPFYGMQQTNGDAVILMSSDFQDPINLISKYISSWENGHKVILGKKISSDEFFLINWIRKIFYLSLKKIAKTKLSTNTTGAGLYDKSIIKIFKNLKEPYPYIRGLISEFYEEIEYIDFHQPKRKKGKTKNNIYTLYDIGILGIIKHSTFPLRIMVFLGFLSSIISLTSAFIYLIYKLLYWSSFDVGVGPIIIGMFFLFSVTILMLGIIGEYIITILNFSQNLPLVIEKERINFN